MAQWKSLLTRGLNKTRPGRLFSRTVTFLAASLKHPQFVPPGHPYSPIPSIDDVRLNEDKLFARDASGLPGIMLEEANQLKLLETFASIYKQLPYGIAQRKSLRYSLSNGYFDSFDGIIFFCLLLYARPARLVEIGSGYSTCLALDTRELFFKEPLHITAIDPSPDRLLAHITAEDEAGLEVVTNMVQNLPISVVDQLMPNDILFVDSSHVAKVGSDVNHIIFNLLPRIKKGVYVHFHDVFYPFEYPRTWIFSGKYFSESYLLRAFLQSNNQFEIIFYNSFMERFHRSKFEQSMPLCLNSRASSIWLRKKRE
jgi:hypothetical protein